MSESKNTKWVRLGDYIEVFDKRNTDVSRSFFTA